jgi:hypothetical protein
MVWVNELRVSVLDCGSPLPLFHHKAGDTKRQRAAAVQNLAESSSGFQSAATRFLNRFGNPTPRERWTSTDDFL